MTYAWAHWMLPALQADPVLAPKVVVVPGWETRGRPPSQFSFLPSGIVEHHTACMCKLGHDPQSCLNTIVNGYSGTPGPISQLLGTFTKPGVRWDGNNVDPHIVITAAGRSNHAGTGQYSWGAPTGNGSSIGIEWCGPVDGWPDRVVEFRERVTAALLRNRNWGVHQVDTHYSYARPVGRKIDPSGRYVLQPTLGLTQPWSVDIWRNRIAERLKPLPPPVVENPGYTVLAVADKFEFASATRWDTRGFGNPLPAGEYNCKLEGSAGKVGATVNLTIVGATAPGFAAAWASGARPNTSKVNYGVGEAVANEVSVPLAADGSFKIFIHTPAHIIVDLVGYWS